MNAHAILSAQGWRGHGHSLHKTDDSIGLQKPLLLNRKCNTKGLGNAQHFNPDQWWLNAFDEQLKGLETSKKGQVKQTVTTGKLNTIENGSLGKYSVYTSFVSGGFLEGTVDLLKKQAEASSTSSDSSSSDDDSDAKKKSKSSKKDKDGKKTKESKQERRARKEAKRERKAARALRRQARAERRERKKAKREGKSSKSSTSSDSSDATKEEKKRRRAKKEEKRRKRKAEEKN